MSWQSASHPSPQQVAAFGLGSLQDQDASEVEEHLSTCESCARLLDDLPRDPFLSALRDAVKITGPHALDVQVPSSTGSANSADAIPVEFLSRYRYDSAR